MGLGEEGPDLGRLGWGSGLHFPSSQVFEDLLIVPISNMLSRGGEEGITL